MEAEQIAEKLVEFYQKPFGGKTMGRYRITMKYMCRIAGCRRLFPDAIQKISQELYQLGYILIDMESYFVIISHKTFTNYRRVNDSLFL
ncbi:MAG: hypothetical protein OQK50_00555 [Deltaproteobacteria bacterium]|jgi:hypothetical protein|nr:hypothetical protein [Deltaproteobacteria bacterium]MCW8893945.1 hypothetical protein [Deltaproteobacteria bacterium]MCW9048802.1 hypothetical protein [Deltaproteobacteria bacterium]